MSLRRCALVPGPPSPVSREPRCAESGLQPPCLSLPSLEPRGRIWASGGENRGVQIRARWACPTPAGAHRCGGMLSSQAAAVESGKGLPLRTGLPVGWVGAIPRPLPSQRVRLQSFLLLCKGS